MVKRGWRIGGLVLVVAFAGLLSWRAWYHPIRVAAHEPALTADVADTLSQVPRSILIAPIVFDLGPAIAQFEADVPLQFGSLDRRGLLSTACWAGSRPVPPPAHEAFRAQAPDRHGSRDRGHGRRPRRRKM